MMPTISSLAVKRSTAWATASIRPASSSNSSSLIASSCVSMGKLFGDDTSNTSPTSAICLEALIGGQFQ